jgi:hypothetical protein
MRLLDDTVGARAHIEDAIKKYGWAAEHNYFWYQYCERSYDPPQPNVFFENDIGALFTIYNKEKDFYFTYEPLTSPEHRAALLLEYIDWIFSNTSSKKIEFQLELPTRKKLLPMLPANCHAPRINYTLTWPVYDLTKFDPTLAGGSFKTIRKEMHKFYRDHRVEVQDVETFHNPAALHTVVDNWKNNRTHHDRAMAGMYHSMVDGGFEGMDEARVFIVDGEAHGFNAGWMIPNSQRFYGAIGIHDYSLNDLGTMLYLEDLIWLKNRGYTEVDMGGSEKKTLLFKKKFGPQSFYKSAVFSILKT